MANLEVFPIVVPNRFGLKSVNFYLVKHDNHLSLIDAGYRDDDCWNAFIRSLTEHSLKLEDITEILLTHHHIDHVGLVNRIVEKHPIPIYCSPLSIPRLRRDEAFLKMRKDFFKSLYEQMGCGKMGDEQVAYLERSLLKRERAINGELIPITQSHLSNFEVVEFPGHSPDQIAFWNKENNCIFAGDLLIEHISSNAIVEPDDEGNRLPSLIQQIESLRKCASLHVDTLYSGHGNTIKNPNTLIKKRLQRIEEKSDRMLSYIQTGSQTANELAMKMYRDKYQDEFGLVMSEIIGHLDYLEQKGKVIKELKNGVWHYVPISSYHTAAN